MGLILVGFGLQDSITAIAKNQFVNLFTYEANVILDSNVSEAEKLIRESMRCWNSIVRM